MDDVENDDGFDVFARKKRATGRAEEKPKVEAGSKKEETNPVKKAINLFADDDDDDDFDSLLTTPSTSGQQTAKSTKVKNLFEDDDDDDDDFFLPPSEPVKEAKPSTSINRPLFLSTQPKKDIFLCNLFDDEPPEDDFDMFKTKPTKTIEKPIKSIFGSSESMEETVKPKKPEKEPPSIEKEPVKVMKESIKNIFDEPDIPVEIEVRSSSGINTNHVQPISVLAAEPETAPKAKPTISSQKSTSTQDALRLFDDTPPDDDELFSSITTPFKKPVSSAVQKKVIKQSGEFYNDFSETITEVEDKTKNMKISSTSLFVDEPLSDGEFFLSKPKAEKQPNKKVNESMAPTASVMPNDSETNQSEFSKKISIFTNPSASEDTQDAPKKTVTPPKKLNLSKIDINVSALLPGARRVIDKTEKVDETMEVSRTATPTASITRSISHDNVDERGRLMNLNRDRAKVPSRRPSTRRGRQQQFLKSLDEDKTTNEVESSDVVDKSQKMSRVIEPKPPKVEPIRIESIEEAITKLELSNSSKVEEKEATIFVPSDPFVDQEQSPILVEDPFVENSEEEIIKEIETELTKEEEIIPEIPETKNEPIAEEENPVDFAEMNIENPVKTKTSVSYDDFEEITPAKAISKATPVFFDEIPPEDTFDHETFDKAEEKSSSSLLSKNALSLFGDDDDDEDNFEDQLFSATLPQTSNTQNEGETLSILSWNIMNSHIIKNRFYSIEIPTAQDPFRESPPKLPSKQVSLFGDDDESDDDIFGAGSNKKKPEPITKPKEPEQVPEILKQSTIVIEMPKKTKPKESSVIKTVPKSSLFDDISDDDDNLFGPPAIPNNVSMKKSSSIKPAIASKSANLFGDDSSDDDLFGSKPKGKTSIVNLVLETNFSDQLFTILFF